MSSSDSTISRARLGPKSSLPESTQGPGPTRGWSPVLRIRIGFGHSHLLADSPHIRPTRPSRSVLPNPASTRIRRPTSACPTFRRRRYRSNGKTTRKTRSRTKCFERHPLRARWSYIGTSSKTSYVDASAAPETFYAYEVKATNTAAGDSSPSGVVSATTTKLASPPSRSAVTADTTPPTGSLTINNGAPYTAVLGITLNLTASDSVGVTGYYFSTNETPPSPTAPGWTFDQSRSQLQRESGVYPCRRRWDEDVQCLVQRRRRQRIHQGLGLDPARPDNSQQRDDLGHTGQRPGHAYVVGIRGCRQRPRDRLLQTVLQCHRQPRYTGYSAACNGTPLYTGSATSFSHSGLTNGTTYYYRVCVSDKAGNTATGATATATPVGGVDTTAPVGTVVINGGAAYTTSMTVTSTLKRPTARQSSAYWLSIVQSPPSARGPGGLPSRRRPATTPPCRTRSPSPPTAEDRLRLVQGRGGERVRDGPGDDDSRPHSAYQRYVDRNRRTRTSPSSWSNFSDSTSGLDNTLPYRWSTVHDGRTGQLQQWRRRATLYTGASTTFTHNNLPPAILPRLCDRQGWQ